MRKTGAYLLSFYLLLIGIGTYAQNAPVSTIGTYNGNETEITIPITVIDFVDIGSCNLKLTYDPTIALAMAVNSGPLMVGQLATNLTEPGVISIGWYTVPGLTLPDNTVIFNIEFSQVSTGFTDLLWDDNGYSCSWSDEGFNYLNDEPTSSYYMDGSLEFQLDVAPHTIAPHIITCNDSVVDIPILVTGFSNIGAVSLTLQYDETALSYQSFTNDSGFPGLIVNESNPGEITAAGFTALPDGFSIADSVIFFTLHCINLGNSTELNWYDNGESCEYAGSAPNYSVLEDTPQELFYYDGSFTQVLTPDAAGSINGPIGGNVCKGETGVIFSVDPIENATEYVWTLPDGATISNGENTNTITVTFNQNASSGNVSVYGTNTCGSGTVSPLFPLTLNSSPTIIEQPVSSDTIIAGNGIAIFAVEAEGSILEFQWQEYVTDWANISNGGLYSGANTSVLTITNPPVAMDGYQYRCIVSGICEPPAITDGLATLHVVTFTNVQYEQANNTLNFNAYPNPFKDKINFNYFTPEKGGINIEIRNTLGEIIERYIGHVDSGGTQFQTLEMNNFVPGIYIAKIFYSTNNRVITATTKIICK